MNTTPSLLLTPFLLGLGEIQRERDDHHRIQPLERKEGRRGGKKEESWKKKKKERKRKKCGEFDEREGT